jgi:hypothetical protein
MTGLVKVSIPLRQEYDFSGVHTLSGEIYYKHDHLPNIMNTALVREMIENSISLIRKSSFNNYDKIMSLLATKLSNNESLINTSINSKGINLQFNYLPIINKIIIGKNRDELKLSMKQLINEIRLSFNDYLELETTRITDLINKYLKEINESKNYTYNRISTIKSTQYHISKIPIKEEIETEISEEKATDTVIFKNKSELKKEIDESLIRINFKKKLFLSGHYNASDFSMLCD